MQQILLHVHLLGSHAAPEQKGFSQVTLAGNGQVDYLNSGTCIMMRICRALEVLAAAQLSQQTDVSLSITSAG